MSHHHHTDYSKEWHRDMKYDELERHVLNLREKETEERVKAKHDPHYKPRDYTDEINEIKQLIAEKKAIESAPDQENFDVQQEELRRHHNAHHKFDPTKEWQREEDENKKFEEIAESREKKTIENIERNKHHHH